MDRKSNEGSQGQQKCILVELQLLRAFRKAPNLLTSRQLLQMDKSALPQLAGLSTWIQSAVHPSQLAHGVDFVHHRLPPYCRRMSGARG